MKQCYSDLNSRNIWRFAKALMIYCICASIIFLLLSYSMVFSFAAEGTTTEADLGDLSLQQLMDIEIISVSKKVERVLDAPSAIYVITQEDIRRSGATTIADALRMAPGLQVARSTSNTWAISARGFNDVFANKLLVLIDGRSVYNPLFSGAYWDVQDTLLEDIERIEVIRGPGASVWGANAVNGVINVVTKSSAETKGGFVTAGGGSEERVFGAIRHGGAIEEKGTYRVFSKYFSRDNSVLAAGSESRDAWYGVRGGFRSDLSLTKRDDLMLQGELYHVGIDAITSMITLTPPFTTTTNSEINANGGHLIGKWTRNLGSDSEISTQLYYDLTKRGSTSLSETRNTIDLEAQHRFSPTKPLELIWGIGYRASIDDISESADIQFSEDSRLLQLVSGFLQARFSLIENELFLILGSKFEYNSQTEFEGQPSARLSWKARSNLTFWASASRAVRTPSRAEEDIQLRVGAVADPNTGLPVVTQLTGSRDLEPEELMAYEAGLRMQMSKYFSFDVATFYTDYSNLRSIELGTAAVQNPPTSILLPLTIDNLVDGHSYGVEIVGISKPFDWWRLTSWYTYLNLDLEADASSTAVASSTDEGSSPDHQFNIRSYVDLPYQLSLDCLLYYTSDLSDLDVDRIFKLDVRLAYHPTKQLELSFVGQNLLDSQHQEFGDNAVTSTVSVEIERGFYGQVRWTPW